MSQILVTARDMAVVVAGLEKRLVETETLVETSKSEPVKESPLPTPGVLVGVQLCVYIGGDQDKVV